MTPRTPTAFGPSVSTVFGRELFALFDSSIAYVACVAALLATNAAFMNEFFLTGKLDMTPFFDRLPLVLVLFLPAIAMRAWSEDLRTRTFELWMTLPMRPVSIVLGKFAAALALYALFLCGTLPIVVMLAALGAPDLGRIAAGYVGALFLGAQVLALGQLFSSLTRDQIVAFLGTAFGAFLLVFSGEERVVSVLDGLAPRWTLGTYVADFFSALPSYESFVRGELTARAATYFTAFAAAFLWMTTLAVERNRT